VVAGAVLGRWRRSGQPLWPFLGSGLVHIYARLWHGWTSNRPAPLPPEGPAILVANHTCSADPAFLAVGSRRLLSFLIAKEYYKIPLLKPLFDYLHCVPVTRNGEDTAAVRLALRRLSEQRVVCIFPEGGLSNAGRPRPRRGKNGVALLALRSRAPVYPALILRGPQTHKVLRSWMGPSRVRVVFGQAVDLSAYYDRPINRQVLEEVTRFLMDRIHSLRLGRN
jgi:1-acyl-sn-glycerol-3-phosphate acyltransferase